MVFERGLKDAGIDAGDMQVVMELGTGEAIVNAVEGGMGVGIVSRLAAEKAIAAGTVATLDVEGFPLERPFYIVTGHGAHSRPTDALTEHLKGLVPER